MTRRAPEELAVIMDNLRYLVLAAFISYGKWFTDAVLKGRYRIVSSTSRCAEKPASLR